MFRLSVLIEMAARVQSSRLTFLLIFTILSASLASQNYNLLVTDVKCIVNPNYISNISCSVDSSTPPPRINIVAQMIKVIRDLRVDFFVNLERSNGDSISLFRLTDLDGCKSYRENVTLPILKIFRDRIKDAGAWPTSCPLPADQRFSFRNLTLESDFLPSYIPEAEFKITVTFKDTKLNIWKTTTLGRIVRRRANKAHRIS